MIELSEKPIDIMQVFRSVEDTRAGGHSHFVGTIREDNGITGIDYECYETMALSMMQKIAQEAGRKWPILKVAMVHRHGWVPVGEAAVVIAVACAHRAEAFEACRYLIDRIKEDVPIWKKEDTGHCRCQRPRLEPEKIQDITGVVLAGGRSTRFGRNKAFAHYQGMSFVERAVHNLGKVFDRVLLVTNTPEEYRFLDASVIQDEIPHQGPFAGVITALKKAETRRIFVVACDMPLLNPDIIRQVVQGSEQDDAVIPIHETHQEYLMAVYSQSLLKPMEDAFALGVRSLKGFCRMQKGIRRKPITGSSWFNVNTPFDLQVLERAC